MSNEANYVLVHGAWHGSWCWKKVRNALQAAGHNVFTPTLTGLGERSHLNSADVNLSTHIADIVNLIKWEGLSNVVLCGHSYGGYVITGAADQLRDRIRALIYLDAFVPEDGGCLFDLVPQEVALRTREQAESTGQGWMVNPIPAAAFNVNASDSIWVDAQCTPHPIATFEEPVRMANGLTEIPQIVHVLATDYETLIRPAHDRAKIKGWKTHTLSCGHDTMLDLPDKTAELLLEYA